MTDMFFGIYLCQINLNLHKCLCGTYMLLHLSVLLVHICVIVELEWTMMVWTLQTSPTIAVDSAYI